MSERIQLNTGAAVLDAVLANVNATLGGGATQSTSGGAGSGAPTGELGKLLSSIGDLLKSVAAMLDGGEAQKAKGGSTSGGSSDAPSGTEGIAGTGRIWGDPHFIGQDGDKYDVQGEAGKTYNLLSDKNFQMNGRFDAFGGDGATAVGALGISAGSDQIDVSKDGTVMVNGRELKEGDEVDLANGGSVKYGDGKVTVKSGEWTTDVSFQDTGDKAHLNVDVRTDNAVADGVKPHGLLGQTFDADSDARMGDEGSGAQGGGAIEGSNGNVSAKGDKKSIELYEVDDLHDRNFESFNQFFDKAEADPAGTQSQIDQIVASAFATVAQSMLMLSQSMQRQLLQQSQVA